MSKYLLGLLLCCSALVCFGQQRKDMAISVFGGLLNSPYYENARAGLFEGIDFDYYLGRRHILSVNYFAGRHDYFDKQLSQIPNGYHYVDGVNATAFYRTTSILYKFKVIDGKRLSVVPGAGAGILTHSLKYPYKETFGVIMRESGWSDLAFPVSLDVNVKVSSHWQAGLTGGFLVEPDFPVLAWHAGPRISYVIR